MLYTDDHGPAHAHVLHAGCEAIFFLNCTTGPVTLRKNKGFPFGELRNIAQELDQRIDALCKAWERLHADDGGVP